MEALVIYDTQFGNTRQIARAIAGALGERYQVRMLCVADIVDIVDVLEYPAEIDLVVVGGPTQRRQVSEAMRTFLDHVPFGALRGIPAAAFDTRYRGWCWLTGSGAEGIAEALERKGAHLVAKPESFFMEKDVPPRGEPREYCLERLESGAEERAGAWARRLSEVLAPVVGAPHPGQRASDGGTSSLGAVAPGWTDRRPA